MNQTLKGIISDDVINHADSYREQFQSASPFKHIVVDNFFDAAVTRRMLEEFPEPPDMDGLRNEFGGKGRKHSCTNVRELGDIYTSIDAALASPAFATFMSNLTGIEGLLYDPEYVGGGTHNNFEGQGMFPHVDFNYHPTTGYHRRINAIVYLNEEWDPAWGGTLELHSDAWDIDNNKIKEIVPKFGTCVVFETSEHSWHGFEKIALPDDRKDISRKSFAIYMYSNTRPQEEIFPKHATIYVQKPLAEHVVPGHTMSEGDVKDIKDNFHARNLYLKSLYDRETRFISTVAALNRQIERYQQNYRPPVSGMVEHIKSAPVPYPDGWVQRELSIQLEAISDIGALEISTTIPGEGYTQDLTITIEGVEYRHSHSSVSSDQVIELNETILAGSRFSVTITGSVSASPQEMQTGEDKRPLSFMLRRLVFLKSKQESGLLFRRIARLLRR